MGLTVESYRKLRNRSSEHFAPIWPSYDKVDQAKKDLRPRDIIVIPRPNLEVKVPLQSVCDFQLEGILLDPSVKARFLSFARGGFQMRFVIKIGSDGLGAVKVYLGGDDQGTSVFASTFSPISLIAAKGHDFAKIYDNNRVNASSSHCYLRLKHEKEVKNISQMERDRILDQVDALVPVSIEGFPITIDVLCTCCDGKLKSHWCNEATTCCYICGAGPEELKLEWHPMFARNPLDRLRFGISLLHAFMRSFGWLLKGKCYQDVRGYSATKVQKATVVDLREQEMVVCLYT